MKVEEQDELENPELFAHEVETMKQSLSSRPEMTLQHSEQPR